MKNFDKTSHYLTLEADQKDPDSAFQLGNLNINEELLPKNVNSCEWK